MVSSAAGRRSFGRPWNPKIAVISPRIRGLLGPRHAAVTVPFERPPQLVQASRWGGPAASGFVPVAWLAAGRIGGAERCRRHVPYGRPAADLIEARSLPVTRRSHRCFEGAFAFTNLLVCLSHRR
jgi:hypothetical protein